MQANNRKNPFLLAPASALAVLVLLLLLGIFSGDGGMKTSVFVGVFALVCFGIPLIFHLFLRGAPLSSVFPMQKLKKRDLLLVLFAFFSLIFLQAIWKYVLLGAEYDYHEIALYGFTLLFPSSLGEWVMLIFSAALAPAVMEELFFRGALFYEYRLGGAVCAVVVSSLLGAMLGQSFSAFPWLFLSGLMFAIVRFLTDNLLASMLLHIAYAVYTLTLEKYIWLMSLSAESRTLFSILCVLFFGISLFLFLHLAEKTLRERAKTETNEPLSLSKRKRILAVLDILSAQSLWILLCVYLILSVVRLFL